MVDVASMYQLAQVMYGMVNLRSFTHFVPKIEERSAVDHIFLGHFHFSIPLSVIINIYVL